MIETKIALLRGINVGAHRRILMLDLRKALEKIELKNVVTYIQSGNLIFASEKDTNTLEEDIAKIIKTEFNFDVPVIVKTHRELQNLVTTNPFYIPETDISKLHITFLKTHPKKKDIYSIDPFFCNPDQFEIKKDTVFLCLEQKYYETKLSNAFFEKKLMVETTTRNWKTTLKLLELSEEFKE